MPAVAIAAVGTAVAAAGTVASISAQNKQAKYAQQANDIQRQQADMAAYNQKRDAIRAARLAQGQSLQSAANAGVSESSSAYGGLGSIQSQIGSNISFLDRYGELSDQASVDIGKSNAAGNAAGVFGAIAGTGMKAAGNADTIAGVFK